MHSGKKYRYALWLNEMHSGKKVINSRIRPTNKGAFNTGLDRSYMSQKRGRKKGRKEDRKKKEKIHRAGSVIPFSITVFCLKLPPCSVVPLKYFFNTVSIVLFTVLAVSKSSL